MKTWASLTKRALCASFLMMAAAGLNTASAQDTGLDRHDFLYAGEARNQHIYKVCDGRIAWHFQDSTWRGEVSDAMLMNDGNILVAHQYGIHEVAPDSSVVWGYDVPEGYEVHSARPIGRDMVVFVQCGDPMTAVVMDKRDNSVVRSFTLPHKQPVNRHGQNRSIDLTEKGTLLVASMEQSKVFEFDSDGNQLASWDFPRLWGVSALPGGNMLLSSSKGRVAEMNPAGEIVWEYTWTPDDKDPAINTQKAYRLANGNTVISNWWNEWRGNVNELGTKPSQLLEVQSDGTAVWRVSAWEEPVCLGPATVFQPLDSPMDRDNMYFGDLNAPQGIFGLTPAKRSACIERWNSIRHPRMMQAENQPLGIGRGLYPGRVAWVHAPGVASWDGETGLWVEDCWNNQEKADRMIREAISTIGGDENTGHAWNRLFQDYNRTHGRGEHSYRPGEKIAIKLNMNNVVTHHDTIDLNSSPFVTLALLRSLIIDAGVLQEDITVCEPSRTIPDSIYNKCHREFPLVTFVDNIGGDGRVQCEYYPDRILYSVDNGKMAKGVAKCVADADYVINSALLKTHKGPGVTLTAKNWYGATDININWRKNAHNSISQDKKHGTPSYKTFVDWMGHKDLGAKGFLYLIDGTYASRDVNGKPAPKWQQPPFNNDWCCSILMSQDEVAVDAVGLDMIVGEWPEFGSLSFCDEYLKEAATIPDTPSGTTYDPERDGTPLTQPLGLFEHWNNPVDRQYQSIDLIYRKLE